MERLQIQILTQRLQEGKKDTQTIKINDAIESTRLKIKKQTKSRMKV